MSNKDNGGPAFPVYASDHRGAACNTTFEPKGGKTMRDEFAIAALPLAWDAYREGFFDSDEINNAVAECAYQMADAMLQEREK